MIRDLLAAGVSSGPLLTNPIFATLIPILFGESTLIRVPVRGRMDVEIWPNQALALAHTCATLAHARSTRIPPAFAYNHPPAYPRVSVGPIGIIRSQTMPLKQTKKGESCILSAFWGDVGGG